MSKLNIETITKYAITLVPATLRMHFSKDAPSDALDSFKDNSLTVTGGTLLKVFQTKTPGYPKYSTVQVLEYERPNPIFDNCLFECPQVHIRKVNEDLWPYLIGISDPERRTKFLKDQQLCQYVLYSKINDFVSVSGRWFGKEASVQYDCIIRYIGPVEEMRPVGYCFGLELLTIDNGKSPQQEIVSFSAKYTKRDPSLTLIVTADQISQISSESKKKFSALDLFNDTVEKVKSVIAPGICVNDLSNTSSLKREKKPKKKEPTAHFYGENQLTPSALRDHPFDADVTDKITRNSDGTMERRKQIPKSKSNSHESEPSMPIVVDDYKQTIENYEKNLERQRAANAASAKQNLQTNKSSYPNDLQNSPSVPQPAGILKHHRTPSSGVKDESTSLPEALTLLRLEDRDIVVIDNADIQNATKNESSVLVVDGHVDLKDLLGSNWPSTAGDAANILNKSNKSTLGSLESSSSIKTERVKSSNPLSHFGSTKSERGHRTNEKGRLTYSDMVKKSECL